MTPDEYGKAKAVASLLPAAVGIVAASQALIHFKQNIDGLIALIPEDHSLSSDLARIQEGLDTFVGPSMVDMARWANDNRTITFREMQDESR